MSHLQRRVQHAKHLLADGANVSMVALTAGFNDQARFKPHFRMQVGVTPPCYAAHIIR